AFHPELTPNCSAEASEASLSIPGTGRDGYAYSVECSGTDFHITARHRRAPDDAPSQSEAGKAPLPFALRPSGNSTELSRPLLRTFSSRRSPQHTARPGRRTVERRSAGR